MVEQRDEEAGVDLVAADHADVGDERLRERFLLAQVPGTNDLAYVRGEFVEFVVAQGLGGFLPVGLKLTAPGL